MANIPHNKVWVISEILINQFYSLLNVKNNFQHNRKSEKNIIDFLQY
jgi:ribosomal protein S17E